MCQYPPNTRSLFLSTSRDIVHSDLFSPASPLSGCLVDLSSLLRSRIRDRTICSLQDIMERGWFVSLLTLSKSFFWRIARFLTSFLCRRFKLFHSHLFMPPNFQMLVLNIVHVLMMRAVPQSLLCAGHLGS